MRVRNAITESQANGYSIAAIMHQHGLTEERVLALLAAAAQGLNSDRDEKYVPTSVSPSKPSEARTKVFPHVTAKDRLGALPGPSAETYALKLNASQALTRGWYYEDSLPKCRVCTKPILPTGKRGRPRLKHKECE